MSQDRLAELRRELERRLAELPAGSRAEFERTWHAAGSPGPSPVTGTIPVRDPAAPIPMSYAQELLWLLERANPGHAYNVPRMVRLKGPLDLAALQHALDALVDRHAILRTTFTMAGDESRQRIAPPTTVPVQLINLRALPVDDRESEARRRLREIIREPFDLERDPQLRATVVELDRDDHVVALLSHHIASDGWSGNLLLRELGALYAAFREGRPPALPAPGIQFADFAAWERTGLDSARRRDLLRYWRDRLAGATPTLDLPVYRASPAIPTFEGDTRSVTLPPSVADAMRALVTESNATTFMIVLAALYVVLVRYTGEEELIVGTPSAGRTLPELDSVVGFFANTLLLRTSLARNPTFRELLARVRDTVLGAFEHQDTPLESLLLDRMPGGAPTAVAPQVVLVADDPDREPFALAGTEGARFGVTRGATKFDLGVWFTAVEGGLKLSADFRTDLFDGATIDRMLTQLGAIIDAASADPDAKVLALPMMSADERHRVLVEWNATAVPFTPGETLLDALEAQLALTPDATAVADVNGPLSYRALHERADALARWLRNSGVRPGTLVAVCVERSSDLVITLLGVLKAGGAYVPLDPDYPAERLRFMLDDSAAPVLVTQAARLADLTAPGRTTLALDRDWHDVEAVADAPSGVRPGPADAAYMIYTSGSTGQPKGALNSHGAIVNRLRWMQDEYRLTARDVVLQKTPASFDVSVWEFFWPLITGARLLMARPGGHRDPGYLAATIGGQRVTVLHFVPSMLAEFLATPGVSGCCATVRDVICSGEALPVELAARFGAALPNARLHNLYGPTEAAVDVAYHHCTAQERGTSVPIGRPIANTTVYVLDALGAPVPVGVPGELYIGGVQVGMGYHHRPELTAQRFLADPFASAAGARMYRTGDRVRWLPGGELQFLGRLDFQVKLRGQRIELGEIEAVLLRQPGVRSAVALVREDTPGDQRLVAYVTPEPGGTLSAPELRAEARHTLPDVMVPAAIVILPHMPVTANGKLDRRALPPPGRELHAHAGTFTAPTTPLENEIAAIWSARLGIHDIGLHDDFFDLGGSSLLAMRMLAEVERLRGQRIPFQAFFEQPTIANIVAGLVAGAAAANDGGAVVLQADGLGTPLAFVHGDALGFGWYCRRLAPLLGSSPLIVFPTLGPRTANGAASTEAMASAHVAALRDIQPHGPYRIGGFCHGALVGYEMARQLARAGETVERLVMVDPFCSNLLFRNREPEAVRLADGLPLAAQVERRAEFYGALQYRAQRWRWLRGLPLGKRLRWLTAYAGRKLGIRFTAPQVARAPQDDGGHDDEDLRAAMVDARATLQFVARAQRAFMPAPYDGKLVLIWAREAMTVRPWLNRWGGWNEVAPQAIVAHVPGTHIDTISPMGLPRLAEQIRQALHDDSPGIARR